MQGIKFIQNVLSQVVRYLLLLVLVYDIIPGQHTYDIYLVPDTRAYITRYHRYTIYTSNIVMDIERYNQNRNDIDKR